MIDSSKSDDKNLARMPQHQGLFQRYQ